MTREQMEVFANNPDNFSPEEWRALENIRSSCNEYKKETEELIKEVTNDIGHSSHKSPTPKKTKSSSQKKSKKKNWIPL